MENKFNINKPFELEISGGYKQTTTIIFCDYTRTAVITQDGVKFPARVGFCGTDKKTSKPSYLFIQNSIYLIDDTLRSEIFEDMDNTIGLLEWLCY